MASVGTGAPKLPAPKVRSRRDGAAIPLDAADKRLMNLLQSSFPLDPEPYALIAPEAGMSVEEAPGAGQDVVQLHLGLRCDQGEGLGVEREARLQQVHQPLVVGVERHRGAVAARADLCPGLPEWRVRAAQSQAAASFA